MPDEVLTTRKQFLLALAGAGLLPAPAAAVESIGRKLLIVVAHPDDEFMFAAATYRLVRELGWTADQVVITNGEAGYRYSTLAQTVYGVSLSQERDGRAHLPAIRKEEVIRAGKILGIRRHFFLDQKDLGFATNAASAATNNWDRAGVLAALHRLLESEHYDAVFTLLPTAGTHGHHRAATLLTLEAASLLPAEKRPLLLGADVRSKEDPPVRFAGLSAQPLSLTGSADPVIVFDRTKSFGYHDALNYQVVVNWVIAEHKSQGLFQMDCGRYQFEQFWVFKASGTEAPQELEELRKALCS